MRNIIALLLIVASIGVFFGYIKPTYSTIQDLQNQDATYDDSLVKIQSLNDSIVQMILIDLISFFRMVLIMLN